MQDTKIHQPTLVSVNDYLQGFLPAGMLLAIHPVQRSSQKTWTLVYCNAQYDIDLPNNHYVAAWSREQLGDDEFHRLLADAEHVRSERAQELTLRLDLCKMDLGDAASPEEEAEMLGRAQSSAINFASCMTDVWFGLIMKARNF